MDQTPQVPQNNPILKNKTPFLGKIAGVLILLAALVVFVGMFITDTYGRLEMFAGVALAVCGYLVFRQDVVYAGMTEKKRKTVGDRPDVPVLFHLGWTIGLLLAAGGIVAWVSQVSEIVPRVQQMFF